MDLFPINDIPKLIKSGQLTFEEGWNKCRYFVWYLISNFITFHLERFDKITTVDRDDLYQECYIAYHTILSEYLTSDKWDVDCNFMHDLKWNIISRLREQLGYKSVKNNLLLNADCIRLDKKVTNDDNSSDTIALFHPAEEDTEFDALKSTYNIPLHQDLMKALSYLPDKWRKTVEHFYFDGMTLEDISKHNCEPVEVTANTYSQAMRLLRREEHLTKLRKYKVT